MRKDVLPMSVVYPPPRPTACEKRKTTKRPSAAPTIPREARSRPESAGGGIAKGIGTWSRSSGIEGNRSANWFLSTPTSIDTATQHLVHVWEEALLRILSPAARVRSSSGGRKRSRRSSWQNLGTKSTLEGRWDGALVWAGASRVPRSSPGGENQNRAAERSMVLPISSLGFCRTFGSCAM